jgi:hypothetical protein
VKIAIHDFPALSPRRRLVFLDGENRPCGLAHLRGFNISGACKSIGVPCAGPSSRAASLLAMIAGDGFNLVRLPIVWEKIETNGALDPARTQALVEFVREAGRHGLGVLVDLHQDILGSVFRRRGYPETHGTGFPVRILRDAYAASEATAPFENPAGGATSWTSIAGTSTTRTTSSSRRASVVSPPTAF